MQNEVKRRPIQQKSGDVTGWPLQQQKGQQLQGGRSAQPQRNAATTTPTARRSNPRSPLSAGKPIRSQQAPSFSRQPGYKTTSAVGTTAAPFSQRPAIAAKPGSTRRMPDNQFAARRFQPSSIRPSSPPAVSPVFLRTTYNTSPAQTMATTGGTSGNQQPYIFNPDPDISSKTQPFRGDGTLPNPGKTPDDMPNKQPCTCGKAGNGCTVLSHFLIGSAELTKTHLQQIDELADIILENRTRFITITRHTDAQGTDENNTVLGNNRSVAVNRALRQVLHQRQPWSQTTIFWKTRTKGESEPVSDTDAGMNRRVLVCLK